MAYTTACVNIASSALEVTKVMMAAPRIRVSTDRTPMRDMLMFMKGLPVGQVRLPIRPDGRQISTAIMKRKGSSTDTPGR